MRATRCPPHRPWTRPHRPHPFIGRPRQKLLRISKKQQAVQPALLRGAWFHEQGSEFHESISFGLAVGPEW